MAKILDMPKLSPTMEEGVLSTWHKNEGDAVEVDDLLAEVETDKATMEFRAFDKGTLLKILITPGTQVKLGQPVAILGNAGDDLGPLLAKVGGGAPSTAAPPTPKSNSDDTLPTGTKPPVAATLAPPQEDAAPAAAPAKEAAAPAAAAAPAEAAAPPPATQSKPAPTGRVSSGGALDRTEREAAPPQAETPVNGRPLASPYVRKAARELGIDLAGVHGSGPGGRIAVQDLDAAKGNATAIVRTDAKAVQANGPATTPAARPGALAAPEARPLSMMRKTIARRLTESKQTVPHFYLTIDVDAGELVRLREQINEELAGHASAKKADPDAKPLKVSLNDLLIKACATALVRVPECNAQFSPEAILVHKRVDISVAVAIPDGLVTPVLRDADRKSVVRIAEEVRELAVRARSKKLKPEDMMDGTFSISNLGMFGIDEFSAVINPPEGAILAIGQARDEAVVRDGQVVAGKRMAMTLSCDHRAIDGAVGAAFLAELRALLERPMRILTG